MPTHRSRYHDGDKFRLDASRAQQEIHKYCWIITFYDFMFILTLAILDGGYLMSRNQSCHVYIGRPWLTLLSLSCLKGTVEFVEWGVFTHHWRWQLSVGFPNSIHKRLEFPRALPAKSRIGG